MTKTRSAHRHASRAVRRRRTIAVAILIAVVAVAGIAAAVFLPRMMNASATDPAPVPSTSTEPASTPAPDALTPAQALLATTSDPNACAVTFDLAGTVVEPQLVTQGQLYGALPIPRQDGAVFAGWYANPADAAAYTVASRVNGADLATCTDREQTVYGSWTTPEAFAAEDTGVPILMYHQFTANPGGEDNSLRLNYAYIGDFDAHMNHIASTGFYLPTWDELSAFIDGALFLPNRSVIITDDDADRTWLEMAVPVVEKYGVLTTSFVITKWRSEGTPGAHVIQRSHTNDMHEPGANGEGRMVNWTAEEIAADMETSAAILGAKQVMAYPFGHYNDTSKEGLRQAGFEMARTIEQGYVRPGADKLALPCIRINYGMTVDDLSGLIG